MPFGYINPGYMNDGYFEEDFSMAIDQLPTPPTRGMEPPVFVENADAFLAAFPTLVNQINQVVLALTANSTNSTSITPNTIASSGTKDFVVQIGKSYVVGMTVRAAITASGDDWMQGDVIAYDNTTGEISIIMNASQGSGTASAWTLTLSAATGGATPGGSLSQDFSAKSVTHNVGSNIASASTINLATATGNLVHVTGNIGISAVTMTAGKDVWVVFDGTPILTHHATNQKLNNNGSNITVLAGSMALYTYDGVTVRCFYFPVNGKALQETAAPSGTPVGSCLIHFGSSAPANHLAVPTSLTNVSRTTYAALFAAIGTTWGNGDGSTTFALPYFAANYTFLQANPGGGAAVGSAYVGDVKAHVHAGVPVAGVTNDRGSLSSSYFLDAGSGNTGSTGGSANLAAGMRILICIRYQ